MVAQLRIICVFLLLLLLLLLLNIEGGANPNATALGQRGNSDVCDVKKIVL
jgi:hypothetical protein